MLVIIGAIIPKSEKKELLLASVLATIFLAVIALAGAILALEKGDIAAFILGVLAFVIGVVKSYIDYKRGS
jgi:1,4-dihydroxy-2-naphthoate octaprenyltransferase